ncbi:3-methylornithyl-N6-L-lysine dehydrogenase PylD [Desulfococcaceae bacterium HSG9]|nr:3-methylornithyl-N6-L-lysine dehydrogenase PylD [Desulfococcaceae bacterium HSG9]
MTRLKTDDFKNSVANLDAYDSELTNKTGYSLRGVACCAEDVNEVEILPLLRNISVGVVPVTSGKGVIGGFCEALKTIACHIGCRAFVTQTSDLSGLVEAFEKGADIILSADDDRFIAFHAQSRRTVDNATATGKAYAVGLDLMSGGVKGLDVLVIGCGPVGRGAAEKLIALGAQVSVYDIENDISNRLADDLADSFDTKVLTAIKLESALTCHKLIIDASPAQNIIQTRHITPDTYISVPGVPHGLSEEARLKNSNRFLHDPLQLGVATMLAGALTIDTKSVC